ncbi:hypothetical protein N7523_005082 [Penicillium sp. IBT 18751x]|nr:hypothetical protein N7523_005082 [Penicillium sp. IBT 18751x]
MIVYVFLSVVASLCSALVLPDQGTLAAFSQAFPGLQEHEESDLFSTGAGSQHVEPDIETWWEMVSAMTRDRHDSAADLLLSLLGSDLGLDGAVGVPKERNSGRDGTEDDEGGGGTDGEDGDEHDEEDEEDDDEDNEDGEDGEDEKRPGFRCQAGPDKRPRPGHSRHPTLGYARLLPKDDRRACPPDGFCPKDHTIWELINESAKTSRLASLIENNDDLISVLNSTAAKHTLFAPTNRALERLLHEEPPNHLLKQIEHYHVIPGLFDTDKLQRHQTLPTALNESSLGENMPQRVVVNKRRNALVLNGLSRIVAGDILANNGIIHHINIPLLPPPNTSAIIELLPAHFSTFAHGLERTKLTKYFWMDNRAGGTTFAPTNAAFERLGPLANAFLFSPQGEQCLRSLLQYHIVLNQTMYSDALYAKGNVLEFGGNDSSASVHVGLPTMLKGQTLDVDVATRGSRVEVRVNGFVRVVGLDLVAKDGVLHVLNEVLLPSKKVGGKMRRDDGVDRIGVEWLTQQLGGCVGEKSARMDL